MCLLRRLAVPGLMFIAVQVSHASVVEWMAVVLGQSKSIGNVSCDTKDGEVSRVNPHPMSPVELSLERCRREIPRPMSVVEPGWKRVGERVHG